MTKKLRNDPNAMRPILQDAVLTGAYDSMGFPVNEGDYVSVELREDGTVRVRHLGVLPKNRKST